MLGGEKIYRGLLRGVRALAPRLVRGDSKLARGIRGRRHAARALARWGRGERDPDRPTLWVHAPSVGEGIQAGAVIEALRRLRPGIQVAYTYFSPSAEGFAPRISADVAAYLPWDLPDEVGPVLDALEPDLVVFTKTEVWPGLSAEGARRGIPLLLVGATLPPDAGRLGPVARRLLRPVFRRLARVCAISSEDAARFGCLGVGEGQVEVTGDPSVDAALLRLKRAGPDRPFLRLFQGEARPVLVAGSTWPADEEILVPALSRLRDRGRPHLRLVVAPHEPRPDHLRTLARRLMAKRWRTRSLSEVEKTETVGDADAVIVDRVGPLALLYTVGELAWVGGGFGTRGLHSVVEPAAAGLPVLFGPRHANARAAGELLEAGGARQVGSVGEAAAAVRRWLEEGGRRKEAGRRSRRWVEGHQGAAEETARVLAEFLA